MRKLTVQTPTALTIAGSDCSGGAGIQADLKTFTALGVYGASVITALTAQNTIGIQAYHQLPPGFIAAQFDSVAADLTISAVKTGMLGDEHSIQTIVRLMDRYKIGGKNGAFLVVDPVMTASSGDSLLAADAFTALRDDLIPSASLITPNLPEAARLLNCSVASCEDDMREQARALLGLGCGAVLLTGGHADILACASQGSREPRVAKGDHVRTTQHGSEVMQRLAVDVLYEGDGKGMVRLELPFIETPNAHGTGCTLSAAITANLALGMPLAAAVKKAKTYLWSALLHGKDLQLGRGSGPVDHLFALKDRACSD